VQYLRASQEPGIDPERYVLSMNVYRRHLTSEQKREVIAAFIESEPQESNRKISLVTIRWAFLGSSTSSKCPHRPKSGFLLV
jgi:hypothetical protein